MARHSVDEVGIIRSHTNTTPRIGSLGGKTFLWDEPTRTNLVPHSNDFTKWGAKGVVEPNVIIAPDGTITGTRFIPTSGNFETFRLFKTITVPAGVTALTFSVFVKKETVDVNLRFHLVNETANPGGNIGTSQFTITSGEKIGYGWYRHTITATSGFAAGNVVRAQIRPDDTNDTNNVYYIWGAQLEDGAYATSFIPTTTTAVTRPGDNLAITGNKWGAYNTKLTYFGDTEETFASQIIENGYWFPKSHTFNKDRILTAVCTPIVQYANPHDLLGGHRRGIYYDPSDLSTMFQDHMGMTPVTAPNQSVGLILDKSKELKVGTVDRANNGNFHNALTGWTTQGSAVATVTNEVLRITAGGNPGGVYQDIARTKGLWSKITFRARKVSGTGHAHMSVRNFNGFAITTATVMITDTEWKTYEFYTREESEGIRIYPSVSTGDGVVEFDDIKVFDFEGHHAYQELVTKRPKYNNSTHATQQTIHYLEFDGTNDFMETGYINFSGADSISFGAGIRKIVDTADGVIFEFSGDFATNSGVFNLLSKTDGYSVGSSGTLSSESAITGFPINVEHVLGAKMDISSDYNRLRVNGNQVSENLTDQGGTYYGTHKMYIGARGNQSTFFNGRLYNLLLLASEANTEETKDIEAFSSAKCRGVLTNS